MDYQFQVNSKQTNICISGAAGLILGHPFDTTKVKKKHLKLQHGVKYYAYWKGLILYEWL